MKGAPTSSSGNLSCETANRYLLAWSHRIQTISPSRSAGRTSEKRPFKENAEAHKTSAEIVKKAADRLLSESSQAPGTKERAPATGNNEAMAEDDDVDDYDDGDDGFEVLWAEALSLM
ncbi:hypothetical protein V1504DRAFT_479135 [Lipomyces starkeyi]